MAQDGPRWPQDGSKMAHGGPKMVPPRRSKIALRWPKTVQDSPKRAHESPKTRKPSFYLGFLTFFKVQGGVFRRAGSGKVGKSCRPGGMRGPPGRLS